MTNTPPLAKVLPAAAALLLRQAALTPTTADPLARVKAIEQATARVKREWSAYFLVGKIDDLRGA